MNTNAMKHGCCAVDARLLPGESEKEFKNLERLYNEAYNPKVDYHRKLISELVNADWLLQRTTKAYLEIEARLYAKSTNPLDWTVEEQRTLGRFQRYRTAHANTVARCRKAVEDFRKFRFTEVTQQQKIDINNERLKSLKTKNEAKPEPSWKDHLEQMRQQAIALGFTPPDPAAGR
jgi:hypothetical protein